MNQEKQHYNDGLSYEFLIRRINPSIKDHFAGQLQHLLNIEAGFASRIPGQPTLPAWRDSIRKKLLRAIEKLNKRKRMSEGDRTLLHTWHEYIQSATTASELNHAVQEIWPIVKRILPQKE